MNGRFPMGATKLPNSNSTETFASDALLLGRVTYLGFAEAWPGRTDEQGFADRFNAMPKYVVSTTLTKGSWNNSQIIRENVVAQIEKLKQGIWRRPGHPRQRQADQFVGACQRY